LQQCTNFCTNFSPKKWGEWGTRPPVEKSGGTPSPASPPHYTPAVQSRTATLTEVGEFVDTLSDVDRRAVGVDGRRAELIAAELFKQLGRSATVPPLARARRAVGPRQADQSADPAQISVLQVNRRLADGVVRAQ